MSDDLERVERALAQRIVPKKRRDQGLSERRQGVVVGVNSDGTDGTVDVEVGGVVLPNVKRYNHYTPLTGDVVFVEFTDTDVVVVGRVGVMPRWPNAISVAKAADGSTGSTSYVNWPTSDPLTFPWRKFLNTSEVMIQGIFSGIGGTADVSAIMGVRIGSTDFDIRRFALNLTSLRLDRVGVIRLAGIAAGLHTVTFRLKVNAAGTTVFSDVNVDVQSLILHELPTPTQV